MTPGSHRSRPARRPSTVRLRVLGAIALGGVFGALARAGVLVVLPTQPGRFPWGTFWVNISGSMVLGFLLVLLTERFPRSGMARPLLGTGLIGAYTTFSTLSVEAVLLVRAHHALTGGAYVVLSLTAGMVAVFAGMLAGRRMLGPSGGRTRWPEAGR